MAAVPNHPAGPSQRRHQYVTKSGLEHGGPPSCVSSSAVGSRVKETALQSVLSVMPITTVLDDLRYGTRMLSRNAGASMVTVLALALGIGVNTAAFTAYKAMVARPLDARDPTGMVNLALTRDSGPSDYRFSYLDYEAYRDSMRSFSGLVAFRPARVTLSNVGTLAGQRTAAGESPLGRWGLIPSGAGSAEFASVFTVSENYFEVLGVSALHGRTFGARSGGDLLASPSVLVSENYWRRRFAGDRAILGKRVHLNGLAVTIVGVTPRDFVGTGMSVPAFWVPVSLEPLFHADDQWLRRREDRRYRMFGRLATGVSIGQTQAEMGLVAEHLRTLHDPRSEAGKPATALVWPGSPFPLPLSQYGGLEVAILLIMVAAGMVLAVACANVGSLQLARAGSRQNELRTRLALGAGQLRLVRQLLTESALLSVLAGAVALFLAWALLRVSVALAAEALPVEYGTLIFSVNPDLQVFGYVLCVSLVAGMLSGLAPARESSRSALSPGSRASTSSARGRRTQDVLVAAQVALSLVLMIMGSVLIRSSVRSLKMSTGYDGRRVLHLDLQFPETAAYTAARKRALAQELRVRFSALPGVAEVTSARPPIDSRFRTAAVPLDGSEAPDARVQALLHYTYTQPNYFQTLGIPLLLGRHFQPQTGIAEQVVILSESAARQLWPGQNPVGHSLRLGSVDERIVPRSELAATGATYQVLGVVRDKRGSEFDGSDSRHIYLPLPAGAVQSRPILVRTESDPEQVMKQVDAAVASVDPDIVASFSTLEGMLRQSPPFILSSFAAAVASIVGLLGLLLALMGIYGTVSYLVVLRTREVGIRMAVGAQRGDVLSLILRESARPVLAGSLIGVVLAAGASGLARGLLYGLKGIDSVSFVGTPMLLLTIALLAAYPPARRAMGVDPIVALRHE